MTVKRATKKVELGDQVKEVVTGFTGIVTARYEYLNNCVQFHVVPQKLDKDGKPQDGKTYDEERLVVVKKRVVKVAPVQTGGPDRGAPESAVR